MYIYIYIYTYIYIYVYTQLLNDFRVSHGILGPPRESTAPQLHPDLSGPDTRHADMDGREIDEVMGGVFGPRN